MCVTIKETLEKISPEIYYKSHLQGHIGKPTGNGWHKTSTLCPFHADKKPGTFHVNLSTGNFHCFSCQEAGDILDFHMKAKSLNIRDALQELGGLYSCKK